MQRLYEGAFSLPTRGMRNTKWGIVWLLVVTLLATVRPLVLGGLSGRLETIASLFMSGLLWLVTPYLLLGRRLHWLRLLPVAVLSVIGMTGVGIWSVLWMPHTIATSADQFGIIGIGFALLTWFVAVAGVLVVAATGGAMISDRVIAWRRPAESAVTASSMRSATGCMRVTPVTSSRSGSAAALAALAQHELGGGEVDVPAQPDHVAVLEHLGRARPRRRVVQQVQAEAFAPAARTRARRGRCCRPRPAAG